MHCTYQVIICQCQYQSHFRGNKAWKSAGAIYIEGLNLNLSLTDSTISSNSASYCGALLVEGSKHTVNIIRSIFHSNQELEYPDPEVAQNTVTLPPFGGVAFINSSIITILNSSFSANNTSGHGGVLHIEHSTFKIICPAIHV